MAFQVSNGTTVPHATGYLDLLSKLVTFANANGWTTLENSVEKVVLRGTGAGSDQIYVGLRPYHDATNDAHGWNLNGYIGYQNGLTFLQQPGAMQQNQGNSSGYPSIPLWDATIPYWFVVSARRIIVVAKVSTTYHFAYLGFYLPFATPNQYPYPLMVGGSFASAAVSQPRYSRSDTNTTAFWSPQPLGGSSTGGSSLWLRQNDGVWLAPANFRGSLPNGQGTKSRGVYPYLHSEIAALRPALSGEYVLTPLEVMDYSDIPLMRNRFGEIDGLYHLAGFSQAAENTVTIGGTTYVVFPNVFRTGTADYVALRLS